VMRNGRFEQIGAKNEIYTSPATDFVAAFVGHANRMEGQLLDVDGALARMSWNGMALLVPRPAGAGPGDKVRYFIKHEDIEIVPAGVNGVVPNDMNVVQGHLRDIIFKGQTANYIVAVPDGGDLVVSDTPRASTVRANEAVQVRWPAGAGSCFPSKAG